MAFLALHFHTAPDPDRTKGLVGDSASISDGS